MTASLSNWILILISSYNHAWPAVVSGYDDFADAVEAGNLAIAQSEDIKQPNAYFNRYVVIPGTPSDPRSAHAETSRGYEWDKGASKMKVSGTFRVFPETR